tara:strand:+ start:41 stop:394 length:354 start_codon:yes stop_codon:yes gene_type:complete
MAYFGKNAIAAWVSFDQYNNNVHSSYNIASTADNGTGEHTFTFSTAMGNSTYCWTGTASTAGGTESSPRNVGFASGSSSVSYNAHTSASTRVRVDVNNSNSPHDCRFLMIQWTTVNN